jgi:dolichyl-phosphate-mannose--protein O-mannosyl transferase
VGTGSVLRVKQPGCGIDHTSPSNAKVEGRVELHHSPSWPTWPVFTFTIVRLGVILKVCTIYCVNEMQFDTRYCTCVVVCGQYYAVFVWLPSVCQAVNMSPLD